MIQVSSSSREMAIAWRVRDALARHPLLGGATADIQIEMCSHVVVLEGWVLDEGLSDLVHRLASRAAGQRPIRTSLRVRRPGRRARDISPSIAVDPLIL